jgi:L-seryl-tRNA(Ser) seleniumtransferase
MEKGFSQTGGGSLPAEPLPTRLAVLKTSALPAGTRAYRLRKNDPPVYVRVTEDSVQLAFRSTHPGEIRTVRDALIRVLSQ